MPKKPSIPARRYTSELLVYEAFYVALRNALIVALVQLAVFMFLIAVEDYPRPAKFVSIAATMMEIAFVISFLINFLYYAWFIRVKKYIAVLTTVLISCLASFLIFFSDLEKMLTDMHQITIVTSWFVLLAIILIVNKLGNFPDSESRYDHESWLYRHELAETADQDEPPEEDPEAKYVHRYIEDDEDDENA